MGRFILVLVIGLASIQLAAAQTTVTTDPVGFITLNVNAPVGPSTTNITLLGLSMTQVVEFQGLVKSGGTIPPNTVPAAGSPGWTDNQYNAPSGDTLNAADKAYFVEIISGPNAGRISDITGTIASSQSLQTADNLGLAGGESFKIRRHWTLSRVFGPNTNTNNQVVLNPGGSSDGDQVIVYNASAGTYLTYYYKTASRANSSTGWRLTSSANPLTDDYANQKLGISDGIFIRRQTSGGVSFALPGAVKLGQTQRLITTGTNLSANVYPTNLTLATSNLYNANTPNTSLTGGGSSDADQILLYNGSGYDTYYYKLPSRANNTQGWRTTSGSDPLNTDVSNTPLPAGGGFFIVRQSGRPSFFWTVQQPF